MNAIVTWLLVTAALLLVEALTAGLTTIWFAGGAVAALICAFMGGPLWLQTGIFAAVSLILLLVTRPLALKYMRRGTGKTSLDRMIGQQVLVTEQIDNLRGTGEAQIDGQYWMARAYDNDQIFKKGEIARIRAIQGVKLIVEKRPEGQV
ncbi:MAG: NfeD family protein [Eubacteriales bacterium]|nr:NfeD family protein [Eubacteriales bacterium]